MEILEVCKEGAIKNRIVCKLQTNYNFIAKYITELIDKGLIEIKKSNHYGLNGKYYLITEKGNEVCEQYIKLLFLIGE